MSDDNNEASSTDLGIAVVVVMVVIIMFGLFKVHRDELRDLQRRIAVLEQQR